MPPAPAPRVGRPSPGTPRPEAAPRPRQPRRPAATAQPTGQAEEARSARYAAAALALETAASAGSVRAIIAIAHGALESLERRASEDADTPPPHVAAAMIAAGLYALSLTPEAGQAWADSLPDPEERP